MEKEKECLQSIPKNAKLLFRCIVGSQAYGTAIQGVSDVDYKFVYMQDTKDIISNNYIDHIIINKDDSGYEISRFIELLVLNNPNILEILYTPEDSIVYKDPIFDILIEARDLFLTKQIKNSFGGYALSQIRKARGLNKKIVNPVDKIRKTPLDFCFIINKETGYMSDARKWLGNKGFLQENIGLSELPNGIQTYKVYYDYGYEVKPIGFRGIIAEDSNTVRHSEVPKDFQLEAFLYFNLNGYSSYCKEYNEYWEWVGKRNPHRYNDNISHKQNYDGKNMMHCLRLLDVAIEVGEGKGVIVRRPDRDFLLSVKKGVPTYDAIMGMIEEKQKRLNEVFETSTLPESITNEFANEIILKIRNS